MKRALISVILLLVSAFGLTVVGQDGNTYPTAERLFHISRSANRNLVCYDVNLEGGKIDRSEPLKVYWVNREKSPGETNGLSYIQRKMAYGYKLISSDGDNFVCSLTAYPSRELTISRSGDGYVCYITIAGDKAILKSLYVKAKPKNPLSVEYVELRGTRLSDGKQVTEQVKK